MFSYSQNNGQSNQNNVIKIEYIGYSNNAHVFKVTNKQPCEVKTEYKVEDSNLSGVVKVLGNSSYTILVPGYKYQKIEVKARSLEKCPNIKGDNGWVETETQFILPIKFEYLRVKIVDPKTIIVYFKALQTDNERQFNIQVCTDGKSFKTVAIVLPDPIVVNKEYTQKIKL